MATSTLQTNENNDLYLPDSRNLVILEGVDACRQNVDQAVKMRLGENPFSTGEGVDYFGAIFTPQQSYDDARQSLIDNISACPDVVGVDELTIDVVDNTFVYSATVSTIYGQVAVTNQ